MRFVVARGLVVSGGVVTVRVRTIRRDRTQLLPLLHRTRSETFSLRLPKPTAIFSVPGFPYYTLDSPASSAHLHLNPPGGVSGGDLREGGNIGEGVEYCVGAGTVFSFQALLPIFSLFMSL